MTPSSYLQFLLDLVNSDFTDEEAVTEILDTWEERGQGVQSSHHSGHGKKPENDDDDEGVVNLDKKSIGPEVLILFRRHFALIIRDPILYVGRSFVFLVSCLIFALVYLKARKDDQDQAQNKFWLAVWVRVAVAETGVYERVIFPCVHVGLWGLFVCFWFWERGGVDWDWKFPLTRSRSVSLSVSLTQLIGVPSQMGVVAVYSLNDEFKSLLNETKNGMVSGVSYVFAKSILVVPIMFVFAMFSLGIPLYAVMGAPAASLGPCLIIFACTMFVFESLAETLSVWFEDPILGMLQFMNCWYVVYI